MQRVVYFEVNGLIRSCMERLYIKVITKCIQCPHFCDEGEFCNHPKRERCHVVYDYPMPDDCPLQEKELYGKE